MMAGLLVGPLEVMRVVRMAVKWAEMTAVVKVDKWVVLLVAQRDNQKAARKVAWLVAHSVLH